MNIENPEWRDAPFELGYLPSNGELLKGIVPLRFKTPPPREVYDTPDGFGKWVEENAIPKFIEVP